MTEAGQNRTFMEFALLALFTCSLASVIATVFRGTSDEEHIPSVGLRAPLRKHRALVAFCSSDLPSTGESIDKFIDTSHQQPVWRRGQLTALTTTALGRHGVELLPVLQNLSINVH